MAENSIITGSGVMPSILSSPVPLKARIGLYDASTPSSASSNHSVASTNSVVSRYGYDLSRDYAVLTKLEDITGRPVEPEELQSAMNMLQGQRPTVLQIAGIISNFSPPCSERDEAGSMASGSYEADMIDANVLQQLQLQFESAMDSLFDGDDTEDGSEQYIETPRSVCTPTASRTSSINSNARCTPSVPSLCLGTMRKTGGMGLPSHRSLPTGRDTVRTRRRLTQLLDPALLRVLLPAAARKAAGKSASNSSRSTTTAVSTSSIKLLRAPNSDCDNVVALQTEGRPSADDIDQQAPVGTRRWAPEHTKKAAQVMKDFQSETTDTMQDQDLQAGGRTHRGQRPRNSLMQSSIASHALGAAWWAEYAIDEEEEEVLLPEDLWSIHSVLQQGAPDMLSSRISGRSQMAQTAYSLVYTALLDGTVPVVVKVLDVGSKDLMANAFAEASVLDSLRGWSGSVQMLACGRSSDNQVQLVLQRCDMNLRHWAQQHPARSTPQWPQAALTMFSQVVDLVQDLHSRSIAHCDIKLDNVLILGGQPVLSDFSEAITFADSEQAYLHESRGTEVYQSPEMFIGRGTDARSADVWALGCLLYELMTGSLLFPGRGDCLRPGMGNIPDHQNKLCWMRPDELSALTAATGASKASCTTVLQLLGSTLVSSEHRINIRQMAEQASSAAGLV